MFKFLKDKIKDVIGSIKKKEEDIEEPLAEDDTQEDHLIEEESTEKDAAKDTTKEETQDEDLKEEKDGISEKRTIEEPEEKKEHIAEEEPKESEKEQDAEKVEEELRTKGSEDKITKKEKSEESDEEEREHILKEETEEEKEPINEEKKVQEKKNATEKETDERTIYYDKETPEEIKKEALEEIKESREEEKEAEEEIKEDRGFFQRLKDKITKTKVTEEKFDDIFWELEMGLLENNVAVEVIDKIKEDLKERIVGKEMSNLAKVIEESLVRSIDEILSFETYDIIEKVKNSNKPYVILFLGINGTGKTTTIAKFINLFKKNNISCVVAASDTFRAAAIDQLQEHTDKLGVKLIKHDYGSDPAAVAYDAIEYARSNNIDTVLIDTAGRMHSNKNLMDELAKIIRVSKPNLKLFIGDALTGNDCIEQAKMFNDVADIDGIIISKADTDEKGGTALSVSYVTGKPLLYLGTGQGYDDLEMFNKEKILRLLSFD